MNKYMIEVLINGRNDYLPIKAESEKKAITKAMKLYKGMAFLGITERNTWKKKRFGTFGTPNNISSGYTYVKSTKHYGKEEINTYDFDNLEVLV